MITLALFNYIHENEYLWNICFSPHHDWRDFNIVRCTKIWKYYIQTEGFDTVIREQQWLGDVHLYTFPTTCVLLLIMVYCPFYHKMTPLYPVIGVEKAFIRAHFSRCCMLSLPCFMPISINVHHFPWL